MGYFLQNGMSCRIKAVILKSTRAKPFARAGLMHIKSKTNAKNPSIFSVNILMKYFLINLD